MRSYIAYAHYNARRGSITAYTRVYAPATNYPLSASNGPITASGTVVRGGSKEGQEGPRPPVKFVAPMCPPPKKKVQDKAPLTKIMCII